MKRALFYTSLLSLAIFSATLPVYAMEDEAAAARRPGFTPIHRLDLSLDLNELSNSITTLGDRNPIFEGASTHLQHITVNISLPNERWVGVPIDTQTGKGHIILESSLDPRPSESSYLKSLPSRFYSPYGSLEVQLQDRETHPNGWVRFSVVTEYDATFGQAEPALQDQWTYQTGKGHLFYPSRFRGQIAADAIRAPFVDELTKGELTIHLNPLNPTYYKIDSVTLSEQQ